MKAPTPSTHDQHAQPALLTHAHLRRPGNPDFARRLGVAEFIMARATCSCDELHHPFRVGLSVDIHWPEPLVVVVVPGKDDIGAPPSKDPPQCI
jgi:hypothetical protein